VESFLNLALDGGEWWASMSLLLYPWGKCPQYPLAKKLGEPYSWSGHCEAEKNLSPLPGIEHQLSAHNLNKVLYEVYYTSFIHISSFKATFLGELSVPLCLSFEL
jgi:hypothetical protein